MPWVLPANVSSPQEHWSLVALLYDDGPGEIAIARGLWSESPVIAIRWNGSDDPGKSLGNPQSSGHATWFILPDSLHIATLQMLAKKEKIGDVGVQSQALSIAMEDFGLRLGDTD